MDVSTDEGLDSPGFGAGVDADSEASDDTEDLSVEVALPEYAPFLGHGSTVYFASDDRVTDLVEEILVAEGPATGFRLHSLISRASGQQRLTRTQSAQVDSAITRAVAMQRIVEENPLGEAGVRPRTYRLPDQPEIDPRRLGPRKVEHVPPSELEHIMTQHLETGRIRSKDAVFADLHHSMGGTGDLSTRAQARLSVIFDRLTSVSNKTDQTSRP